MTSGTSWEPPPHAPAATCFPSNRSLLGSDDLHERHCRPRLQVSSRQNRNPPPLGYYLSPTATTCNYAREHQNRVICRSIAWPPELKNVACCLSMCLLFPTILSPQQAEQALEDGGDALSWRQSFPASKARATGPFSLSQTPSESSAATSRFAHALHHACMPAALLSVAALVNFVVYALLYALADVPP